MSKEDPISSDLNKNTKIPSVNSGLYKAGAANKVGTNWKNINWTRKKLFFASIILGLPYIVAIIASFAAGVYLITGIFVGLGILVAFLYQVIRWIEGNDDF